jgi:prevent-host-death family protein
MTSRDYFMAMRVGIASLKARLSEYLREVRRGRTVTVVDRDTAIAQIVPYDEAAARLTVRRRLAHSRPLHEVPLPPPLPVEVDIVDLLLQERRERL